MNKILLLCLISFAFSAKTVSQNGINLIKEFEECRLEAYQDSDGAWTIGYGTTNADRAFTKANIYPGLTISQEIADKWLKNSLNKKYGKLVNKYDGKYKWTQNEFDALISFVYDIGSIDQLTANGSRSRQTISKKILQYVTVNGQVVEQ